MNSLRGNGVALIILQTAPNVGKTRWLSSSLLMSTLHLEQALHLVWPVETMELDARFVITGEDYQVAIVEYPAEDATLHHDRVDFGERYFRRILGKQASRQSDGTVVDGYALAKIADDEPDQSEQDKYIDIWADGCEPKIQGNEGVDDEKQN